MKNGKFAQMSETLKTVSVGVSLLLTIGGVVIGIFNFLTLNQLQPFGIRVSQIEKRLDAHEEAQLKVLDNLATRDQVNDLLGRVDKISTRVDLIIGKLIQ